MVLNLLLDVGAEGHVALGAHGHAEQVVVDVFRPDRPDGADLQCFVDVLARLRPIVAQVDLPLADGDRDVAQALD
eukprot:15674606-Heterocapsa_arctica.AAC.1